MSSELPRQSETPAPIVGGVYKAKRSRSGREWECTRRRFGDCYLLSPLGPDAYGGGGGVRALWRTAEEIESNFVLERLR